MEINVTTSLGICVKDLSVGDTFMVEDDSSIYLLIHMEVSKDLLDNDKIKKMNQGNPVAVLDLDLFALTWLYDGRFCTKIDTVLVNK